MLDFTFENQGNNVYLVYKLEEGNSIDSSVLGMLTNNSIPGIAPTTFTQVDEDVFLKYNISHKVSMKQYFSGNIAKKNLLGVFNGIIKAFRVADEYMIDASSIVIDENYIYIDVSTQRTDLICLPVVGEDHSVDMKEFFKKVLFNTKFDSNENCSYVASLMNYLNGSSAFRPDDFAKVLEMQNDSHPQKPVERPQSQVRVIAPQPVAPQPTAPQPVAPPPYTPSMGAVQPQRSVPEPQKIPPIASPEDHKTSDSEGEKMSMMYLLQHYNKENAAIYKAQKGEQSAGGNKEKKEKKTKEKKKSKEKGGKQAPGMDFAIPGQEIPFSYSENTNHSPQPVCDGAGATQPSVQQPVQRSVQPPVQQPVQRSVQPPVQQPVQPPVQQPVQQAYPMPDIGVGFGQTTVLNGMKMGETTVLSAVMGNTPIHPYLVRTKTGEKIPVNKPVFRIGKERSYVDYFIGDNPAVSRSHANIHSRDGSYYIEDTNSTNHTYVNGNMIQSNMEVPIENGTAISFANESFEFKIL